MSKVLRLNGIIRNIEYEPQARTSRLKRMAFEGFDINSVPASGIIEFADDTSFGYSKWNTPKPSRTYPSARIYKTYHLQTKRVTVIPVIKDEGKWAQNNDRITFMTYSRMNLMCVYIILAWYNRAEPHPTRANRITNQQLNNEFVLEKIREVKRSQKSALHWNELHFEKDYEYVYRQAVESYQKVSRMYDLEMNSAENHLKLLEQCLVDGKFSRDAFAEFSSDRSASAALRETMTIHDLEHLTHGDKAYFELENRLGGKYFVTADEVYWENNILVIQESKNTVSGVLPSLTDIQDGLFKNILFKEIDELYLDGESVNFTTRLKLTGNLDGALKLPIEDASAIDNFGGKNNLTAHKRKLLRLLNEEARKNTGLSIEITGN
ncbi:MAG: hypothetical protein OXE52_05720 [Chloroflexi bacterium]|nr:hypothetical protein [Chloroflexota bacterium]